MFPGCMTPSEVAQGVKRGLKVLKFFPAEQAGGLAMIKAMAAPYTMVKFMPTGGINAGNLGEYLASHGYVVVSVDQNACNMLSGENDGRAVLLLENIGLLLGYNEEEDNPLEGVLDADNIAIAGHSRGGEMVATAYLFNGYDNYPENGNVDFDYHYNIRSIIAIAPTVDQ